MIKYDDFPLIRVNSDTINAHVLAAATAEADTIPVNGRYVMVRSTGPAFFRVGATATVPADTVDGSAAEYVDANCPALVAIYTANTKGKVTATSTALTVDATDGLTIGNSIVVKGAAAAGADLTTTISAINQTTKVVTLGVAATTTVVDTLVTSTPTTISLIAAGTPTVTLSYYR